VPAIVARPCQNAVVMPEPKPQIEEKVYRQLVDEVFHKIDGAFENVDPDLAESMMSQGTLTVLFEGKVRFILSPQTPVRQIWAAFKDRAWHFDLDSKSGRWMDDRGRGIELYQLVADITRETVGQSVQVSA
jgi:CyaY protein